MSRFSQPSGLSIQGDWLYVADAEDAAVRRINLKKETVETLVGKGLFDFGDRDGDFDQVLLQHVLGVAAVDDKRVAIADTYNNKIKLLHLDGRRVETLNTDQGLSSGTLDEPGGLALLGDKLLIADTNNHRIMSYDLQRGEMSEWKLAMPDGPAETAN